MLDLLKKIFKKKDHEETNNYDPDLEELKEKYIELLRNCISVKIGEKVDEQNPMRFGGMPLAPKDFEWPYFESDSIDDPLSTIKLRPLAFLAPIRL